MERLVKTSNGKVVYNVDQIFEEYGEDICSYCESSSEYYESDTGYSEMNCHGDEPMECQYAIRKFLEENGEEETMNKAEIEKVDASVMNITMDMESFKRTLVAEIKNELKISILTELKSGIVKQVFEETAKPQIESIRASIAQLVQDMVKEEVMKFYTETKITVGGGWGEEPKQYTVQEFAQERIKSIIEEGTIIISSSDGYRSNDKKYEFAEYISKHCVTSEVRTYMDKKLKDVQKKVDNEVKQAFDSKLESMMSEVALGVLKSNATYKDITKKLMG